MNRIYCSIWNARTGTYVAAPEKSHARGKPSSTIKAVVVSTLIVQLRTPYVMAAEIAVANGNTQVFNAPNGVQAIDIATANSAGVSHNQYTKYNVDPRGLILNNNSPLSGVGPMQSQLGGQLVPNQNLAAEARLIINEVVAANRSTLAGYTEVVGRKADVVVANPWGITCNGCGFINTDRATLTTGVPTFGGDGSLSGFRINQGDILINGTGLDARNQNILDLLARSIKVDGQVNAKDLQVVTGSYSFNYGTRAATPLTATGNVPLFAIDSTALGGMYANRIRLIATEAGVGVRMSGEAAASGDDFTLTAAGKIEIHNKISAERDLTVAYKSSALGGAAALEMSGAAAELSARRNMALSVDNGAGATFSDGKLTAGQDLTMTTGSLTDSASNLATRFAGRDNTVNISGAIALNGTSWGAGGMLAMTMDSMSVGGLGGVLYSGSDSGASNRNLELLATAGGIDLATAQLMAGDGLTLGGSGTTNINLASGGSIKANNDIAASATTQFTNAGNWLAGQSLLLTAADGAASLSNSGSLQSGTTTTLGGGGHLLSVTNTGSGTILAGSSLAITGGALINAGAIQATTSSTVTGSTFSNAGASAKFLASTQAGAAGDFTFTGAVDNQGTLQSAGALSVSTGAALSNSGNLLALRSVDGGSNGNLSLTGQTIANSGIVDGGGSLTATVTSTTTSGNSFVNSGAIQGGGAMTLSVGNKLWNTGKLIGDGALTVTSGNAAFTLDNDGLVQAVGNLVLGQSGHLVSLDNAAYDVTTGAGLIHSANTLIITGGSLSNTGAIQATAGSTVTGTTFNNTGSFLLSTSAGGDGSLRFTGAMSNAGTGTLQSAGGLAIDTSSTFSNAGTVKATGSSDTLAITAATLSNTGYIEAGDVLNLTATSTSGTTVSNSGQIHSVDSLALTSGGNVSNTGKLLGDAAVSIISTQASQTLTNSGRIQSGTSLTLGGAGHLVNLANQSAGILHAGGSFSLTGGSLTNAGSMQATAGSTVTGTTFSNSGSFLVSTAAGADGNLSFSGAVSNPGALQSAGGLTVTSSSTFDNTGIVKASGSSDLVSLSATTITNGGAIDAADRLTLTASGTSGAVLNNSGQIHAVDTLTLNSGSNVLNSGDIYGDGALALATGSAGITLYHSGRLQSGSNMTLGSSGHLVDLVNVGGVVRSGGRLTLVGGELDNLGKIYADTGSTFSLASLINGSTSNSSALILAAMSSGSSTFNVSGALDNYGAIHSNDGFTINAAGITNRNTGGMSSLTTLSLTANGAGDIDNYGAFYAGSALNLTATDDDIINHAATGTIDSSGTITTNSANFTNNNAIVGNGDITITATESFKNETTLASGVSITKTLGDVFDTRNRDENQIATEGGADAGMNAWVINEDYSRREYLSGITEAELSAMTKAQIIANGSGSSLTINYGNSGTNKIAVLSAPTINIAGTGTFVNEDLALHEYDYRRRWIRVEDESVGKNDYVTWASTDPDRKSWSGDPDDDGNNWDTWDPGTGWSRSEHIDTGSFPSELQTWARDRAVSGAIRSGAVVVASFGAGIFAGTFNFTSGTLSNVGSPWPSDPNRAKAGTSTSGSVGTLSKSSGSAGSATAVAGGTAVSVSSAISAGSSAIRSTAAKNTVQPGTSLSFAGLNLTLPSNPNGYFVISRTPSAQYLVETNPLFNVGSNFVGSNYLAERYGFNPDTIQRRLGDANYEAYLIRQQLISQTGNNLLKGYADEAAQMQRLMEQAAAQGAELGLVWGKPLTAAQIAGLQQDIVWMEEVIVGGQKVLAPRVYLAQSTQDMITGGAVIAANNTNIQGDSFSNTGGTVEGSETLAINVKGDVTNTGGTIKGGDVSITSAEGSIINQTYSEGHGDEASYNTVIGKTAGIESTGNLALDAEKDITVLGADVSAGGNASLNAGGEIRFDTIVDKTTTSSSSMDNSLSGSTKTTTTTTTETNIGSSLKTGGNLSINSGGDTVIGGSSVETGGNLDVTAGGSFRVEARQDKVTTHTESSTSGMGVGGGVYGTSTTTTDEFKGTNVGSTIKVGGNATVNTEKDFVLQGSEMDVAGDGNLNIKGDTLILDGLDEHSKTTTTVTNTYLKTDGDGGSSKSGSSSKAGSGQRRSDASAEASAEAGSDDNLKLTETTTTTTDEGSKKSIASTLNFGGNLTANTEGTMIIQGSEVNVGGNGDINAGDFKMLTGRNVTWSNTTTTTTSTGFYEQSGADSSSGAQAGTKERRVATGASSEAGAEANADTTITMGSRTETEQSTSKTLTHSSSVLNVGGNLNINAKNTATFQGAEVESGGNMDIKAADIENLAAEDSHEETYSRTQNTAGVYVGGEASAETDASAAAKPSPLATSGGKGSASAGAEGSTGLREAYESESEKSGSTTNKGSSFKSGGNFSRNATNTITDEATQVEAGGNIAQSAREVIDKEVHDTTFSSSSQSHDGRVGVYAGAEAEAEGNVSNRPGASGSNAENGASAGVKASYEGEFTNENEYTSTAVTSKFKSGGSIKSTTTDGTTLVGTQFEAGGDIEIEAGSLDYRAATDSSSSSSSTHSVEGEAKAAMYGEPGFSAEAGYGYEGEGEKSSTARTGSMSGQNISIKTTKGDATFEGTDIKATNEASIDSAGKVNFKAAEDTTESVSRSAEANAELSVGDGEVGGGVSGSYAQENASSSTARTGGIQGGTVSIKAKDDVNLEGTKLKSKGDTTIDTTGDVNLRTATNSENSSAFGVSAGAEASTDGSRAAEGAASAETYQSIEKKAVTTETGGQLTIRARSVNREEGGSTVTTSGIEADGGVEREAK